MTLFSEQAGIEKQLQRLVAENLCELVILEQANTQEVLGAFKKYRDRIAIFHFAGHADSYEFYLENISGEKEIAHADGFAEFLSLQNGLRLVFLNACSTEPQAKALIDANVNAVIATSRHIDEGVATLFSINFYQSLGSGSPIYKAFQEATAAVKMRYGKNEKGQTIYFQKKDIESDQLPWHIHIRDGCDVVRNWNIPEAAGNPLFGLPSLPHTNLPNVPFRYFQWFKEEDAAIFFGRSKEIRQLYDKIVDKNTAFVIHVYGRSGVGKSSLLAAGLIPRIRKTQHIIYVRWTSELSATALIASIFSCQPDYKSVLQGWLTMEEQLKQPVSIIIDQFEGSILAGSTADEPTDPGNQDNSHLSSQESEQDDFESFVLLLKMIENGTQTPKGKLILSYRKEYLAEIENQFYLSAVDYEKQFVDELDKYGVQDAICGISRMPELQKKYKLEIEEGLAERISYDLLQDKDYLIAPVLQILLSKLWDSTPIIENKRLFTLEAYAKLSKEGILLDDFLDQKIELIRKRYPELVQSGLLFDILLFHVTPQGASQSRTRKEVTVRYEHVDIRLEGIRKELEDQYLLTSIPGKEGPKRTILSHDVLAPLVKQNFEQSDYSGQRARRILNHRLPDWRRDGRKYLLSKIDLQVVLDGQNGMGKLNQDEANFIQASRQAVKRKEWIKYAQWGFGIIAVMCIIGLFINNLNIRIKNAQRETLAANRAAKLAQEAALLAEQNLSLVLKSDSLAQMSSKLELKTDSLERNTNILERNTNKLARDIIEEEQKNMAISQDLQVQISRIEIANLQSQCRELIGKYVERGFSGAVHLDKNGQAIIQDGLGQANREEKAFCEFSTLFDVSELARQITAAAVLKLIDQGKLTLGSKLNEILVEVPEDKSSITIKQLLQNRSGLPPFLANYDEFRKINKKTALNRILNQELLFEPGARTSSTYTDYILLAIVVEEVSKMSFVNYCKKQLIIPAGMNQTGFRGDKIWTSTNVAAAYGSKNKSNKIPTKWPEVSWSVLGVGGIISNIPDLIAWQKYLNKSGYLKQMKTSRYVYSSAQNGAFFYQNSSGDYGQNATIRHYPKQKANLIILSNNYDKKSNIHRALINDLEKIIIEQ
jgi:CubicO group peptidase (beta-lactamase class C family)